MSKSTSGKPILRGVFILVEGVDRSGKTTLTKQAVEMLVASGHKVELFRFPDYTTSSGKIIQDYLQKKIHADQHFIHLLFSANRWECQERMKAVLLSGVNIICDRYSYSGITFSHANGLDLKWCQNTEIGLIEPDLVIYLNVPIEVTRQRPGFGDELYERTDFQQKVKIIYKRNFLGLPHWVDIDASPEIEKVTVNFNNRINHFIAVHGNCADELKIIKF